MLLARQGFAVSTGPSAAEHLRSLPANSLDALVLVDVLEHFQLEDGLEFLRESRRVVRPEGRLIIQTPNASGVFGINTFVARPHARHTLERIAPHICPAWFRFPNGALSSDASCRPESATLPAKFAEEFFSLPCVF